MMPISAEQLNESLVKLDWPHFEDIFIDAQDNSKDDKQTIKYSLIIKPDLSYLTGHFPQQSIVPGVVQVHWAGELAQQFFNCCGFSSLKKVKFSNPILPKMSLQLSLSFKKSVNQVYFVYSDEQQPYSSGIISFQ